MVQVQLAGPTQLSVDKAKKRNGSLSIRVRRRNG